MRPVFVALICLGLIISNGKSAPTKKHNIKWHECLDECTFNFHKDMSNDAIAAFLVPQVGAWLTYRNQSFASMIMEGVVAIDTYKSSNDFTQCLSQCDIYYTQYGLISTTVNSLVLVVLKFPQNFSTNGPYVVLNFCKFSDYMVLIFEKKSYTAYYVFQIGNY